MPLLTGTCVGPPYVKSKLSFAVILKKAEAARAHCPPSPSLLQEASISLASSTCSVGPSSLQTTDYGVRLLPHPYSSLASFGSCIPYTSFSEFIYFHFPIQFYHPPSSSSIPFWDRVPLSVQNNVNGSLAVCRSSLYIDCCFRPPVHPWCWLHPVGHFLGGYVL